MAGGEIEGRIRGHYGWPGLLETIEAELRSNGIDPEHVTVDDLAPIDNFHSSRRAGTLALARIATITAADRVLDVGGGIGGPARQLAHRVGCQVTVLDVTSEYCAVGKALTSWTRLADRVSFTCGSALAMPFRDRSFDVAWTQHASMNIADKPSLYREIARVVRPAGRLAMFDVFAGRNQPIHFPVPWARDPSYSFLVSPGDARAMITAAGFRELVWMTSADARLAAELGRSGGREGEAGPSSRLNPDLLYGGDSRRIEAVMRRNTDEGRISLAIGVFERH